MSNTGLVSIKGIKKMSTMGSSRIVLSALTALSFAVVSGDALAQTRPDAGQTLRDVGQPSLPLPKKSVPLTVEGAQDETGGAESSLQIPVSRINISGNTIFTTETLHGLIADMEGSTHTLAALNRAVARINMYYREHGYLVARAYIPAQEMENGTLSVAVLEGGLGRSILQNKSRLPDEGAARYVSYNLEQGDILNSGPVDRSLLLLADTPGVGGARATLRPGESVGTSDLIVDVDPGKFVSGNIAANNFGNRYTGEYQLDGSVALNSPLNIGDQLSLRAVASNENLYYGRLGYSLPVGYSGLRVGASYAMTSYELAKEFEPLGAHGTAKNASIYALYPFIRSLTSNLYGSVTMEDKRLKDRTKTPFTASDKDVQLLSVGFSGNHQDDLLGGGLSAAEFILAGGHLGMDSTTRAIDRLTADTGGSFARVSYNISRLQRVTDNNLAFMRFSGQQASKNLNSSEEISLGGVDGVRAYPLGEANGDEGWMANIEWRHNLPSTTFAPNLQAIAFYDIGSVKIDEDRFSAAKNTRTIAGAGVGFNATLIGDIQARTYVAWRTSGGDPKSDSDDRVPRVWFQLSKQF